MKAVSKFPLEEQMPEGNKHGILAATVGAKQFNLRLAL